MDARRNLKKQQEDDDNKTEMANNVYGDFLTENPAVAQSAFGAHRVIPDRWKGMTPEQLADIRRQQEIQRKELQVCNWGSVWSFICNSVSASSFLCYKLFHDEIYVYISFMAEKPLI